MAPGPPHWLDNHLAQCLHNDDLGFSTSNHLLCFNLMCCAEKVSNLINHPVVCLFGTRVDGTRVKVVT
jgi:hypothetical protein